MSRSLRTRPTTLYSQEAQPIVPSGTLARPTKRPVPNGPDMEGKVRNRLSMRYASGAMPSVASYTSGLGGLAPVAGEGHSSDAAIPEVPALPADLVTTPGGSGGAAPAAPAASPATYVPAQYASASPAPTSGEVLDPMSAEIFASSDFDARTYVSVQLQQQSESALRRLRDSLDQIQTATQKQLKAQVFKNYSEFITISREIATLENDMLEFKELLSEWKQLPQQLQIEDPISDGSRSLKDASLLGAKGARSSVVDLEQIYKAQLLALWENIEGSQKFVPYVPGRHLIAETSQFVEVNAASYKPKQAVALFLLDDLLLIAVQRKRHYGMRVHLVAERCFGLSEIVVVDLKDGRELKNAIKIKRGKESFVYRTDKAQEKRALLHAFRRVGEDLANRTKRERKSKAGVRHDDAMLDAEDAGLGLEKPTQPAPSVSDTETLGAWLNSAVDELAVHIALREWEAAVSLVEQGKKRLASRPVSEGPLYLLVENFNSCASELVHAISSELVSPYQRKTTVVRDADLLLRLDKGREARDLLLEARTELLRRRTRQIKYEGDVSLYISELAMLYFTLIKNTGDWYMAAFQDYKMASGSLLTLSLTQASFNGLQRRSRRMQRPSAARCMVWIRIRASSARRSTLRAAVRRSSTMWVWVWAFCSSVYTLPAALLTTAICSSQATMQLCRRSPSRQKCRISWRRANPSRTDGTMSRHHCRASVDWGR